MSETSLTEIAYQKDSSVLFGRIRHLDWPIFFDSTASEHPQARYDILAAEPEVKITTQGSTTTVCLSFAQDEEAVSYFHHDPVAVVEEQFIHWKAKQLQSTNKIDILPGLYGYFGYDLGRRFETISEAAAHDIDLPEMACGFFSWIILVDHLNRRTFLANASPTKSTAKLLALLTESTNRPSAGDTFALKHQWQSNLPHANYKTAFDKTIDYINQGDCYQINLAHRLSNAFVGEPWVAYKQLRQHNPTPYAAYFDLGHYQILSLSPEQFIQVKHGRAQTRPIKGTMPRGKSPAQDTQLAEKLSRSEKNRAENLMIVDLLRNDFSKVCIPDSVKVPSLFDLESFQTVHHLVSTVVGILAPNQTPLNLFKASFPGGSITGAPKIRAMNIIDELEPHRRSIYCGSMLYLDISGRLDSNITIRTLLCSSNNKLEGGIKRIYCWAGGGIVADSNWREEYQETFDKISGLLAALQNK